jgi:S1-C subfamily serine protease
MIRGLCAIALALLVAACANAPIVDRLEDVDDETSAELHASMRVFAPREVPRGSRFLGAVRGLSCMRTILSRPATEKAAIDRLLYKTRLDGGNAITNVLCSKERLLNYAVEGCLASIKCDGTGLRVPEAYVAPEQHSLGGTGTGFFINSRGDVLSNSHVVTDCSAVNVQLHGGAWYPAEVRANDPQNDLAVLSVAAAPGRIATFPSNPAYRQGDDVVVYGFPLPDLLSSAGNLTTGTISALSQQEDVRYLQITAPIQPGNSGGPLADKNGHVIGVVSARHDTALTFFTRGAAVENAGFAIKDAVVRTFLATHEIPLVLDDRASPLPTPEIAADLKEMAVFVECKGY